MSITQEDVNNLLLWKAGTEITYAFSFGEVDRKLTMTGTGSFKVYHGLEVVKHTTQPYEALEAYDNLKPKDHETT